MAMWSEEETIPSVVASDHKFYGKRGPRDAAMKKVVTEFDDTIILIIATYYF